MQAYVEGISWNGYSYLVVLPVLLLNSQNEIIAQLLVNVKDGLFPSFDNLKLSKECRVLDDYVKTNDIPHGLKIPLKNISNLHFTMNAFSSKSEKINEIDEMIETLTKDL